MTPKDATTGTAHGSIQKTPFVLGLWTLGTGLALTGNTTARFVGGAIHGIGWGACVWMPESKR